MVSTKPHLSHTIPKKNPKPSRQCFLKPVIGRVQRPESSPIRGANAKSQLEPPNTPYSHWGSSVLSSPPSRVNDKGKEPHPEFSIAEFPELSIDIFKPMDDGIDLDADEIKGRNAWIP